KRDIPIYRSSEALIIHLWINTSLDLRCGLTGLLNLHLAGNGAISRQVPQHGGSRMKVSCRIQNYSMILNSGSVMDWREITVSTITCSLLLFSMMAAIFME